MDNIQNIFDENAEIFYKIYDSIRKDDVELLDNLLVKHPKFIGVPVYGDTESNDSLLHYAATCGKKNTFFYLYL